MENINWQESQTNLIDCATPEEIKEHSELQTQLVTINEEKCSLKSNLMVLKE